MTTSVAAKGDIDIESVPELKRRLYQQIDANPGATVLVDLSQLTFVDSTGLDRALPFVDPARSR